MLNVYSHLKSDDVNRKRLEAAGIIKAKEAVKNDLILTCPRCNSENGFTSEFCMKCGSPLDESTYRRITSVDDRFIKMEERLEHFSELLTYLEDNKDLGNYIKDFKRFKSKQKDEHEE